MNRIIIIIILSSSFYFSYGQSSKLHVFKVIASTKNGKSSVLTGFQVVGVKGIITALHGVVGYETFSAQNSSSDKNSYKAYYDLKITQIDVNHDIAVLSNEDIKSDQIGFLASRFSTVNAKDRVYAIGYVHGTTKYTIPLDVEDEKEKEFRLVIPHESSDAFKNRKSPSLNSRMLSLVGSLSPGLSGAPIINSSGKVVAIGSGGLDGGAADVSWAVIFDDIVFIPYKNSDPDVVRIRAMKSENLFNTEFLKKKEIERIGRLSAGVKAYLGLDNISNNSIIPYYNFGWVILAHPKVFFNKLGFGMMRYANKRINIQNTYLTLNNYKGYTNNVYQLSRMNLFGRYYILGPYDTHKLTNVYFGVGVNYLSQESINNRVMHFENSDIFQENRINWVTFPITYTGGIKYNRKWYTIELEAEYSRFQLRGQNFKFNFFGNADSEIERKIYNNFTVSLNFLFNLSLFKPIDYED